MLDSLKVLQKLFINESTRATALASHFASQCQLNPFTIFLFPKFRIHILLLTLHSRLSVISPWNLIPVKEIYWFPRTDSIIVWSSKYVIFDYSNEFCSLNGSQQQNVFLTHIKGLKWIGKRSAPSLSKVQDLGRRAALIWRVLFSPGWAKVETIKQLHNHTQSFYLNPLEKQVICPTLMTGQGNILSHSTYMEAWKTLRYRREQIMQ